MHAVTAALLTLGLVLLLLASRFALLLLALAAAIAIFLGIAFMTRALARLLRHPPV